MYYAIGVSVPSLHRVYRLSDMYHSIMLKLYVLCIVVIKTNVSNTNMYNVRV